MNRGHDADIVGAPQMAHNADSPDAPKLTRSVVDISEAQLKLSEAQLKTGRPRIYANRTEQQRAYRARRKELAKRHAASPEAFVDGRIDTTDGRSLRTRLIDACDLDDVETRADFVSPRCGVVMISPWDAAGRLPPRATRPAAAAEASGRV
jgi:hypothetical protein